MPKVPVRSAVHGMCTSPGAIRFFLFHKKNNIYRDRKRRRRKRRKRRNETQTSPEMKEEEDNERMKKKGKAESDRISDEFTVPEPHH